MCSLFGLIDYSNALSTRQKNKILTVLSHECECRGTDATGIAYNYAGALRIFKRPLPAHKVRFHIPNSVNVVMGHTRMATQGLAELRACSHKGIDDESKIKKGQKDNIEFVITGENAAESLETAKKSFNLIALFV